jgi:hypothetical protein
MAGRGVQAWPYRRIPGGDVKADSWIIDPDTDRERELSNSLPDWDYQTDLTLRRRISFDVSRGRRAAGLADDAALALSVRWNAVPSLARGACAWVRLDADQQEFTLDVGIPGGRVGGLLHIETLIVLAAESEARAATAHRPGSCLWNDSVEVRLQGDAPLFPIALVPFSKSSLPDKAAWFLELGYDLHATALGAIQLLVNQEHPMLVAAVSRAGAPTETDRAVLSVLKSDVIRSMLERALGDEAFTMTDQFDKDTLGAVLQGLMRTFMSSHIGDDLVDIRRIRENDAPLFAAIVQGATELLVDKR